MNRNSIIAFAAFGVLYAAMIIYAGQVFPWGPSTYPKGGPSQVYADHIPGRCGWVLKHYLGPVKATKVTLNVDRFREMSQDLDNCRNSIIPPTP